MEIIILI